MDAGDELAKLIELAGFKGHQGIRAMLMSAQASPDPARLNSLLQVLRSRAALVVQAHPFVGPEPEDLPEEGVVLGTTVMMTGVAGGPVRLPLARLPEHIYAAGAPGTGKSWLLKLVCTQLWEQRTPFWWFDTQGDVFLDLVGALGADVVLYIPITRFKRNPLEPLPGEEPMEMLARFLDVTREALYLRDGSQNMLAEVTFKELAERGVFQGGTNYPSLLDLSERIDAMKVRVSSRQGQFHDTLTNRFGAIETELSGCYGCSRGFNLAELAKRNVVIGLQGVSTEMQELFVKDLVAAVSALLGKQEGVAAQ